MLAVFVGCRALPAASSGDPLRRPTRSLRSGTFARRNHYLGGSAKLRGVVPRTRERRRECSRSESSEPECSAGASGEASEHRRREAKETPVTERSNEEHSVV